MALFQISSRHPDTIPHPPGTIVSVKQFISAAARYLDARARLLALEARLAAQQMKTGVVMLGGAALLIGTALLILAAGLVLWLTTVLPQGNGAAACGVVAGVFILAAVILIWRGRQAFKGQNHFPVTRSELKTDKQWLKEL